VRNRKLLLLATIALGACGGDDSSVPPAQARPANSATNGGTPAPNGAAGASGSAARPGTTGGGRPAPSVTLAATDVATVKRESIEEGIAITGDLRPIESVEVRARLEGDLIGVYVREGARVQQGQLLARFEASEQESGLASAEADRVAAQSEMATAQWNLEQTNELFKAGAVSERDLKAAEQTLNSAKARMAAAQSRLRATGSLVRDTRVLAPTSGVISRRLVENGEHVARGAGLFTLVRSDVLELAAAVPARQANVVTIGQTVHFSADGRRFEGKVARVSPTVDPATRTVSVFVQIPNTTGALKGGTFASGRVVSRVVSGALVVPSSAIKQSADGGRPYVYRVAGKQIDIAPVQLGVVDENLGTAEVLEGLAEGDRVVVGNVGVLGRGMQVIIAGEERQGGQRAGAARP
jgi:membrane fusion protein (multidrug efflux system)